MMSLQPAPRAQITSWPTGSVALLQHSECTHSLRLFHKHVTLYIYSTRQRASKVTGVKHKQWTGRCGSCWAYWCTCRSQPAELGSSSWPARGSDRSAGWGSVKSSVSAGYFLWPLTTPPDLPPDSHFRWEHSGRSTKKKKKKRQTDRAEGVILLSFRAALLPFVAQNKMFLRCWQQYMQEGAHLCHCLQDLGADSSCYIHRLFQTKHLDTNHSYQALVTLHMREHMN